MFLGIYNIFLQKKIGVRVIDMPKAVAVLISDVHYNLQTLPLADAAMRMAISKANELDIPLIVAGDLHDTKANLRGECITAMIKTFTRLTTKCPILLGNHDLINEKSKDHSLEFLRLVAGVYLVEKPLKWDSLYLIPYHSDTDELRTYLKTIPKGSTIIMHQGLQTSNSGDYIHDKSAINKSDVAGFRVISGHYHTRQSISLPADGRWDYIGNPFSLTFGEALDPEKGFQVLMSDGSLEFIPTNLRKHIVVNLDFDSAELPPLGSKPDIQPGDLVWIKAAGSKEILALQSKIKIGVTLGLTDFRLDLIPTDTQTTAPVKPKNNADLMDSLIDSLTETSDDRKMRLKELWRKMES
jgi:DNA repair exonuclease SbcCD nuclease subunit